MAHAAIHGMMGCLTQTAEPGRSIEPEHCVCCFPPLSPAVQQPMAMCQGAVFTRLFNKTLNDHGTAAAAPSWSEGWVRGTWPASPLSVPRARNGGPSPARGAELHPAAPHSLLAEATSLARANPLLAEGRGARAWPPEEPLPTTVCCASAAWHLLAPPCAWQRRKGSPSTSSCQLFWLSLAAAWKLQTLLNKAVHVLENTSLPFFPM